MAFFNQAINILQTLVVAIGAGLAVREPVVLITVQVLWQGKNQNGTYHRF